MTFLGMKLLPNHLQVDRLDYVINLSLHGAPTV